MNEANWGLKIKQLREESDMTQSELAEKSGLGRGHIARIEIGDMKNLRQDTFAKLAGGLGITYGALQSIIAGVSVNNTDSGRYGLRPSLPVPIRGAVPAGYPDLREENTSGYVYVSPEELRGVSSEGLFALRVTGESLAGDSIHTDDFVVVSPQKEIINGKIYVCRIENEVVAKHVFTENNRVRLVSTNPQFKDIELPSGEILGRIILSGRWNEH